MIGSLILGGLLAVGAMKYWRWRRYGYGFGCAGGRWGRPFHGLGPGGWAGPGWGADDLEPGDLDGPDLGGPWRRRGGRGWGRHGGGAFFLAHIADRLEATPAQERVIRAAVEELREELQGLREEGRKTRADLAAALRKPAFDEVLLGELYARHDGAIERLRKAFVGFAARIHEALDERQRERLAAMLERGPRFVPPGFGW